jgi:hypothetical protein
MGVAAWVVAFVIRAASYWLLAASRTMNMNEYNFPMFNIRSSASSQQLKASSSKTRANYNLISKYTGQ